MSIAGIASGFGPDPAQACPGGAGQRLVWPGPDQHGEVRAERLSGAASYLRPTRNRLFLRGLPVSKLSVVMPVFNEVRTIRSIVERVRAVPVHTRWESHTPVGRTRKARRSAGGMVSAQCDAS